MKAIYTKRSFENDGKYKVWWSKEGYLCDSVHTPYVRLDLDYGKDHQVFSRHLLNVWDCERLEMIRKLNEIVNPLKCIPITK